MKDISIYFEKVSTALCEGVLNAVKLENIHSESGFPEIDTKGIAIIYVPEFRNSNGFSSGGANDSFRSSFYELFQGDNWSDPIYDLGTIIPGESINDTYFAVEQVVAELVKVDVIPIVIGGGQDLTLACYKGFAALERTINISTIDSRLDVGDPSESVNSKGYVSQLLMQRPCYLFNYSNIGLQRPLESKESISLFSKLYFDICRLGDFNADFKRAEPIIRNSDLISIDFNSIKNSEIGLNDYTNVNGFKSDQICQIAKYAGMSDKLSCLGLFDINPNHNSSSDNLVAQIIWYFIEGVSQRLNDFPIGSKSTYTKFHVHLDEFKDDLVFYKSDKSSRWWLEVSYPTSEKSKYERHHLVPCNHEDYKEALNDKIPNLWWQTLQKLS